MLRVVRNRFILGLKKGYKRENKSFYCATASLCRLVEVGLFEDPKVYDVYQTGQLFVHRVFGYRGVVLFNWISRVCDRDLQSTRISRSEWEEEGVLGDQIKELKFERQTFYQVLVDQRDFHQIRSPPEAITLTADRDDKSLYSISGLDYANHADILPFVSTLGDKALPIHHDLYPQFFIDAEKENFPANNNLLMSWQQKNVKWLQNVEVHCETTQGIKVTVMPFYMGCREIQKSFLHWWRYSIRLENNGGTRVQLRQRHWRIFSSTGTLETVKGDGVVGQQPVLSASRPAFQYSSHVSLQAPSGHMWGTFRFESEDGRFFDVRIPPFNLKAPSD